MADGGNSLEGEFLETHNVDMRRSWTISLIDELGTDDKVHM